MISSRSILQLEKDVYQEFRKRGDTRPVVFCDQCDLIWPRQSNVDIIFFGNVLSDFRSIHHLPKNKTYKIWTLSQSFAKRLANIYGINIDHISVLSRYSLYPKLAATKHDIKNATRFIYSGRASTLKNFSLVVNFLNFLGEIRNQKITLEVCAPLYKDLDFRVDELNLHWLDVKYLGDLGPNWVESVETGDRVLINFSFDPFDDFNLSLAQWQSRGGATLSHSSAFCADISGENCYKLDSACLMKFYLSPSLVKAEELWQSCFRDRERKDFKVSDKVFSRKELIKYSNDLTNRRERLISSLNTYEYSDSVRELFLNDSLS